jgi:hypothetical protein
MPDLTYRFAKGALLVLMLPCITSHQRRRVQLKRRNDGVATTRDGRFTTVPEALAQLRRKSCERVHSGRPFSATLTTDRETSL